ncbi:MAG: M56 family metallopeptidase [Muribaculaceae bacterium]|nr:M56 family metallopeptidase [Muribaculaceae bacterium]
MGKLLAYSIVGGLVLFAMYLVYKLFIARENQHSFNRGLLLVIYLFSFSAYPIYNFFSKIIELHITQPKIDITGVENLIEATTVQSAEQHATQPVWGTILIWFFMIGASIVAVKTIITWIRIVRVIHSGESLKKDGYTLVIIDNDKIAPFSWMRYVVINRKDFDNQSSAIIAHELKHIDSYHWLDLLIAQIACIVNWFNPAVWLMRDELMLVHEYQADMAVISGGHNPQEYQMLLIKKAVGSRFPSLANSINHSKLKKRITMMYKSKSSAGSKLKALALVPMVALALGVATVPAVKAAVSTISNSDVSLDKGNENLPDGKIGGAAARATQSNQVGTTAELSRYYPELYWEILNSVQYPKSLEKENIEARAIAQFTINAEGYLTDAKIVKSSGYELFDSEILRVVNSIKKKFTPREKDGKAISVTYTMPFTFKTTGIASIKSGDDNTDSPKVRHTPVSDSISDKIQIRTSQPVNHYSATPSYDKEIYLDGKKISEEEMKSLNPNDIESVIVNREQNLVVIHTHDKNDVTTDASSQLRIKTDENKEIRVTGVGTMTRGEAMKEIMSSPNSSISANTEIYLDGKKISAEEMKALSPETIASMSVDKQNNRINITSK